MKKQVLAVLMVFAAVVGCSTSPAPKTIEKKAVLDAEVNEAIAVFKAKVPAVNLYFEDSAGYAVMPKIFKGAIVVGGAYGKGHVYHNDVLIGYCSMTQGTLGFSFGGQFFREIIFFQNERTLDRFKAEDFAFTAEASAVALRAGAATKTDYKGGMAAFVLTDAGLMVDASLGGQKFNYLPIGQNGR